ncbi:MAG: TolC family protein [Gemmatimonadetes bacterium]|nr:TolC family protein [Gemmatimonadota bacterium]
MMPPPRNRPRVPVLPWLALLLAAPLVAQPAPLAVSLGDAARLAARQGTALEAAAARVEAASARARQRRGALYPDLAAGVAQAGRTLNSATFGFSFRDPTGRPLLNPNGEILGPIPTVDLRYRLQAPLLDLGALGRWKAAEAATDAVSAEAAAQAEGAASLAAMAYVRAARAEAQVTARTADSALAADLLQVASDQLQAGVGIALDVTRARAQLAGTRAQLVAARAERERTLLELRRAIGVPLDAPLALRDSLGGLPLDGALPSEGEALARAERERPDLRALAAQEVAQQRALSAIRWERTPQLGLVMDQGVIGKSWGHLLPTYTWGVQLSVGVFDGFRRAARAEEQQAGVRETGARLRDLRAQGALEVRSALLDLTAAREQLEAVRERLALAEQEVEQARERFRAGVAGNADVIAALGSLNQARTQRNDALAGYHAARVALARATGAVRTLP